MKRYTVTLLALCAIRNSTVRSLCQAHVTIKGGTYRLSEPLTFTAQDSGNAKMPVIYQAASGETPIISGGQQITGWTRVDPVLNIWQAQATVTTATMPRQLFVNAVRATRARTVDYPNYYIPTATGYFYLYLLGSDPQIPPIWNNPTAIEAVTVTQWKMMRCPIAQITNANDVIMQMPCWSNANVFPSPWNFQLLSWWENAYEFLDQPGEWYLNPVTHVLYYIPLAGEDVTTADVELPVLETVLDVSGDATTLRTWALWAWILAPGARTIRSPTTHSVISPQQGFDWVASLRSMRDPRRHRN